MCINVRIYTCMYVCLMTTQTYIENILVRSLYEPNIKMSLVPKFYKIYEMNTDLKMLKENEKRCESF